LYIEWHQKKEIADGSKRSKSKIKTMKSCTIYHPEITKKDQKREMPLGKKSKSIY